MISASQNILPNSSFENDGFWTLQPGWEYAAGEGRNGSRCVKRQARAGATEVHHAPYRVPVSPGQVWRIRSWYKTTADFNGTPSNSKLRLGDQNNTLINAATAPFTVSTEWKMTERTYTVPADGSVTHLRVTIHGNNTEGTLWVDDVSLENITEVSFNDRQALLDRQRRVFLSSLPEDVRSSPAVQAMANVELLSLRLSSEYTGTLLEMKAKWAADNGWPLTMVEYGLLTIPPHEEDVLLFMEEEGPEELEEE